MKKLSAGAERLLHVFMSLTELSGSEEDIKKFLGGFSKESFYETRDAARKICGFVDYDFAGLNLALQVREDTAEQFYNLSLTRIPLNTGLDN